MSMIGVVKERIGAEVAALAGAVEEAADLAELIKSGALPQRMVAAFVLPLGFNASAPEVIAGMYRQMLERTIAVVLVVQVPGDPKAERALAKVDALELDVILALCGWEPAGAIGEFRALRGRLVSIAAGTVFYQIDFAIPVQLRITA